MTRVFRKGTWGATMPRPQTDIPPPPQQPLLGPPPDHRTPGLCIGFPHFSAALFSSPVTFSTRPSTSLVLCPCFPSSFHSHLKLLLCPLLSLSFHGWKCFHGGPRLLRRHKYRWLLPLDMGFCRVPGRHEIRGWRGPCSPQNNAGPASQGRRPWPTDANPPAAPIFTLFF